MDDQTVTRGYPNAKQTAKIGVEFDRRIPAPQEGLQFAPVP